MQRLRCNFKGDASVWPRMSDGKVSILPLGGDQGPHLGTMPGRRRFGSSPAVGPGGSPWTMCADSLTCRRTQKALSMAIDQRVFDTAVFDCGWIAKRLSWHSRSSAPPRHGSQRAQFFHSLCPRKVTCRHFCFYSPLYLPFSHQLHGSWNGRYFRKEAQKRSIGPLLVAKLRWRMCATA